MADLNRGKKIPYFAIAALIALSAVGIYQHLSNEGRITSGSNGSLSPRTGQLGLVPKSISLVGDGDYFIVHFWATWCEPCIEEIPLLVDFASRYPAISVIAISEDKDEAKMNEYLRSLKLPTNWHSVFDRNNEIASELGSYQYPETFLVRKDRSILMKWVGAQPWDKATPDMLTSYK